jgi:hypothetical protein
MVIFNQDYHARASWDLNCTPTIIKGINHTILMFLASVIDIIICIIKIRAEMCNILLK